MSSGSPQGRQGCLRKKSSRGRHLRREFLKSDPGLSVVQVAAPILNIVVPQSPHLPRVAGRPFFMVTRCASWISRRSRHFMQYPVIKKVLSGPDWLSFTPGQEKS